MDKQQPEALRMAAVLESFQSQWEKEKSAELRRLHQVNQELVEALEEIASETYDEWTNGARAQRIAEAALAKHKEQV